MITPRQIRAARGLLGWDAIELGKRTGLSRETIANIEGNRTQAREGSLDLIISVFQQAGVEFLDNQGVRFRPEGIQVLNGRDGLIDLMEDIYDSCRRGAAGDVVLAGAPEDEFQKILGDYDEVYLANMNSVQGLRMRTLIKEGDTNTVSSAYTDYRWAPKEQFDPVPFYAYADKLAIIVFQSDPSPRVFVVQSKIIADAYRRQFESMWSQSKPIPKTKPEK